MFSGPQWVGNVTNRRKLGFAGTLGCARINTKARVPASWQAWKSLTNVKQEKIVKLFVLREEEPVEPSQPAGRTSMG